MWDRISCRPFNKVWFSLCRFSRISEPVDQLMFMDIDCNKIDTNRRRNIKILKSFIGSLNTVWTSLYLYSLNTESYKLIRGGGGAMLGDRRFEPANPGATNTK